MAVSVQRGGQRQTQEPPTVATHLAARPDLALQVNLTRWATWVGRIRESLGSDHRTPSLPAAIWLYGPGAGDAADAREVFAALLPVLGRVLGPAQPETLAVHDSIAFWDQQW